MTVNMTEKGGCLCGQFQYQIDREAVAGAMHCHCTDCQKITGSGKATICMVPQAAIKQSGTLKSYQNTGTEGSTITRCFCAECGSQVLSYADTMADMRFIKAGTLDDSSWVQVQASIWTSSAQSWSPADESTASFEKNPDR